MHVVLEHYMPKIKASDVLERSGLEAGKYFIVSTHREENVDSPENLRDLLATLRSLAGEYGYPVIVSTHPRTRKRLESLGESLEDPLIRFVKPFGLLDYISLQMSAFCVLSDSGTITEEASLLNLPAVTLRNAHERPEGMDEGTLIMSGLKADSVLAAVKVITTQHQSERRLIPVVPDYEGGPVSQQVVRVVLSYTDYINRTVWRKH
jgi:UDP-N-acetylglucosamine 2-epimerase (non-hydrolysing)